MPTPYRTNGDGMPPPSNEELIVVESVKTQRAHPETGMRDGDGRLVGLLQLGGPFYVDPAVGCSFSFVLTVEVAAGIICQMRSMFEGMSLGDALASAVDQMGAELRDDAPRCPLHPDDQVCPECTS